MRAGLTLILLLLVPVAAWAEPWKPCFTEASLPHVKWYYTVESYDPGNNQVTVWFKNGAKSKVFLELDKRISFSENKWLVDCSKNSYEMQEMVLYDINRRPLDHKKFHKLGFESVEEDSLGGNVVFAACQDLSNKIAEQKKEIEQLATTINTQRWKQLYRDDKEIIFLDSQTVERQGFQYSFWLKPVNAKGLGTAENHQVDCYKKLIDQYTVVPETSGETVFNYFCRSPEIAAEFQKLAQPIQQIQPMSDQEKQFQEAQRLHEQSLRNHYRQQNVQQGINMFQQMIPFLMRR